MYISNNYANIDNLTFEIKIFAILLFEIFTKLSPQNCQSSFLNILNKKM